jgi:hypothetical protein
LPPGRACERGSQTLPAADSDAHNCRVTAI